MKVNIQHIAHALFWPYQRKILDLCSGSISCGENTKEKESIRIIPFFTPAIIRQSYLTEAKFRLGINIGGLDAYPQYKAIPLMDMSEDDSADFCYKAGQFCEKIDEILLTDRQSFSPQYDSSFPLSEEYCNEFMLQFAKEWCEREGYEWYEE